MIHIDFWDSIHLANSKAADISTVRKDIKKAILGHKAATLRNFPTDEKPMTQMSPIQRIAYVNIRNRKHCRSLF